MRKKLQKKWILITAVLGLMVLAAGCGDEASVEVEDTTVSVETTAPEETKAATEPATTAPAETTAPETTAEVQENHDGQKKSYLTGLWTDEEKVDRRPMAIMLSNVKQAVPQTGISRAAVIYEAPVEGMITRLMGVFEDYDDLDKIGSVRSARTYFVFWSQQWDAVYAHFGQCDYANIYLDQIDNLNGVKGIGTTVYYRTADRKAPHNAYASAEGLAAGVEKMEYRTHHEEDYNRGVFLFADEPGEITLPDGIPASYVDPGFRDAHDIYFEYDEDTQKYLRYQYGNKQIDDMTGEQLAVDNIIIQYNDWESYYGTQYLFINLWTEGEGYYITQGKAVPITWKGGVEYAPTTYYDADGNELVINPGKTWVCTVLEENKDHTELK
ncbi:MAG: DUF3048 domain-containing protein [Lachnospiraceae bacterium]|nr:DUF3048 domain-containing protein [Lachnospiraceae bacterium]